MLGRKKKHSLSENAELRLLAEIRIPSKRMMLVLPHFGASFSAESVAMSTKDICTKRMNFGTAVNIHRKMGNAALVKGLRNPYWKMHL